MKKEKQTKKSKRKPKPKPIQTDDPCFPEKQLRPVAEARAVNLPPKKYPEHPHFPGKQLRADRQSIIDLQLLVKVKTFPEFVVLLKDILPYWIERCRFNPVCAQNVTLYIRKRAAQFRAADDINVVAIPNDVYGMWDWTTDAERAYKKPDHLITLKVAVKNFVVSRSTLKRKIGDGELQRYGTKSRIKVDAIEVAKRYEKRIKE